MKTENVNIPPGTSLNDLAERQNGSASGKRKNGPDSAELLKGLLEREKELSEVSSKKVVFSSPLITRNEIGIIGRGTVNIVQGAYGSHKSRLAETLAALLLKPLHHRGDFLGFERSPLDRVAVCYIDTERNQREELPFAIQSIKLKAGYSIDEQPDGFRYTSVKDVERRDRQRAVEAYVEEVRRQRAEHLFVVLDVVTDCVSSFNDDADAMALFDFVGNLCDRYDSTFLLVIHQNPGTEKARGHVGTEAANKASTVLQIGFEKDEKGNDSDLIRVRFLKLRRGKRPEPVYLQYSEEARGLVLANADMVVAHVNHRKHKADTEEMAERLLGLLSEGQMAKKEVIAILEGEFSAKNATIRNRLREIKKPSFEMFDEQGRAVRLCEKKASRDEFYFLEPVK